MLNDNVEEDWNITQGEFNDLEDQNKRSEMKIYSIQYKVMETSDRDFWQKDIGQKQQREKNIWYVS